MEPFQLKLQKWTDGQNQISEKAERLVKKNKILTML